MCQLNTEHNIHHLESEVHNVVLPHIPTESWFEEALRTDSFTFHFQAVADVRAGSVHAHEALVRLQATDRWYNGGEIIDAAVAHQRVHVFDAYCRQKALRLAADQHVPGTKVFLNFMPSSIYDPARCLQSTFRALEETSLDPADVVFEVVESEHIPSVPHLLRIRDAYRSRGFGFALDDCGAGSNTLAMVEQFEPDYLKLDKSLTGVNADQRELDQLVEAGTRLNCRIIAEGVETPEQQRRLASAGISLMQGWLFGRPAACMLGTLPVAAV